MKLPKHARFATVCIHAGQVPDPSTGAIITPIFQTSTYVQEELGKHKGYEYARTQNPTRARARGEPGGDRGRQGGVRVRVRHVGDQRDHRAARHRRSRHRHRQHVWRHVPAVRQGADARTGSTFSFVDTSEPDERSSARSRPKTKLVFLETPTNPVLRLSDIAAAAEIAHAHGARRRRRQHVRQPVPAAPARAWRRYGRPQHDEVPRTATATSIGGVVIATRDEDIEWLQFIQNAAGAILSPFDSWLVLRGTKTLAVRMAQHTANGLALAQFLEGHPKVRNVIYPGLPDHPQHELARRQMPNGFGGMLVVRSRVVRGRARVLNRFKLMSLAESLGGVETLVSHPASMTHASVPPERRAAIGLTDSLIRISAGIEDIDDLTEDLGQALGS